MSIGLSNLINGICPFHTSGGMGKMETDAEECAKEHGTALFGFIEKKTMLPS